MPEQELNIETINSFAYAQEMGNLIISKSLI